MNKTSLKLNILRYKPGLKLKKTQGVIQIFDPIRNRFFVQTPEEVVRQLTIQYLLTEKDYLKSLISVERQLVINERRRRFDILVYDRDTKPYLLIECKAPSVPISEDTFRQIANYNLALQVKYLLVTNGINAYCCEMDYDQQSFEFLEEVPSFPIETS